MDEKKQKGTSSSFTNELFGPKESHPSSSSGIFGAIFSPPLPKVLGRESLRSELSRKTGDETFSSKVGTQDNLSKGNYGESQNTEKKVTSSIYHQDQIVPPCPLSSSIYYGGRDTYYFPQNTPNAGLNSLNGVGEDDPGVASRGNWWQGSLYY